MHLSMVVPILWALICGSGRLLPPCRTARGSVLISHEQLSGMKAIELIYSALVVTVILWSLKAFNKAFNK